ncbi:hypothetical protein ABZ912_43430 [Nonomuraea angiospora]
MLDDARDVVADHPGQTIIGDKNYYGRAFEQGVAVRDLTLLRPARKGEPERAGARLFRPLRQTTESINQPLKGHLTWNATAAVLMLVSSCAYWRGCSR